MTDHARRSSSRAGSSISLILTVHLVQFPLQIRTIPVDILRDSILVELPLLHRWAVSPPTWYRRNSTGGTFAPAWHQSRGWRAIKLPESMLAFMSRWFSMSKITCCPDAVRALLAVCTVLGRVSWRNLPLASCCEDARVLMDFQQSFNSLRTGSRVDVLSQS